jgi:myo-inositol 2-dehydrogenase / D-chiro-inositol 1-dehydrogenase
MKDEPKTESAGVTRRDVLKTASLASLATVFPGGLFAAGASERIRVGLIGCGGRGTEAALNCISASPDTVIASLGDAFPDQLQWSLGRIKTKLAESKLPADRLTATPETCFTGFDAYQKVLASPVDLVILASPPFFRPQHLKAAIEAGKHVFTEKPVAVDPVGVRSVIATSELAAGKKLAIVAGTQRRHQAHYLEIMNRVRGGDMGELLSGQCYWNMGALWVERAAANWAQRTDKKWSDMEWQVRNWLFTGWASGDHIVEQHVHNLDVMNWAFGGHPVKCVGMGGRAARTEPQYETSTTTSPSSTSTRTAPAFSACAGRPRARRRTSRSAWWAPPVFPTRTARTATSRGTSRSRTRSPRPTPTSRSTGT